jgi:hypothetical protein
LREDAIDGQSLAGVERSERAGQQGCVRAARRADLSPVSPGGYC